MPVGGKRPGAGRPKGSVSKANAGLRNAARRYTKSALKTLSQIMESGESEASRVAAATALLDRGHGKPAQALTGEDGGAIKHEVIVATGIARPADGG